MSSAWYHVVVIGAELGGLMYAALAARAGYRVLVLGHGSRPCAYRHEGRVFLRAPERFYGFGSSPAVAKVFGDLSLAMEMKNRPQPLDPMWQVAMPGTRLDIVRPGRRWDRELDRELRASRHVLEGFEGWARGVTAESDELLVSAEPLPPTGFRAGARYRRRLGDLAGLVEPHGLPGAGPLGAAPTGAQVRALVEGAVAHASGLRASAFTPLLTARLWTHLRAGLHRVPGGHDGLAKMFLRRLTEQCGDHRPDAAVGELVVRRGKVVEVVLADRGEVIGCDLVVANVPPWRLEPLLPADHQADAWHQALSANQASAWRFVVNVGVDPRVVPPGMAPELLAIADPAAPLVGDNCLWISRPGVGPVSGGEGRPDPGVLSVSALLVSRGLAPMGAVASRLEQQILARLDDLIPWLDDHLQAVHSPALLREAGGVPEIDPTELVPVMDSAAPMTLGASAFTATTPIRNVLLGGDAMFGGLGFEGACLGALQGLALTQRLVRLKAPLSTDRL